MARYMSFKNVVTFVSMTALPLVLYAAAAKARGVGVGHQTLTQTTAVGRAMNPPQLKSPIYDSGVDNCEVLNCGAIFIRGQSQRNNFGDSIPFTAEVYADTNECLRIGVTQTTKVPRQPAAMRIVIVSPTGSVWRNIDLDDTRPVITARTDVKGRYTVQINSGDLQRINSSQNFGLSYGRYLLGTPINCPTPVAATFAVLTK